MPSFAYQAADLSGRVLSGVLEGESEAAVARTLEQRALIALDLHAVKGAGSAVGEAGTQTKIRLSMPELLEFTRQLKVMLARGVALPSQLGRVGARGRGPAATFRSSWTAWRRTFNVEPPCRKHWPRIRGRSTPSTSGRFRPVRPPVFIPNR